MRDVRGGGPAERRDKSVKITPLNDVQKVLARERVTARG
jgi:hypothetical protein